MCFNVLWGASNKFIRIFKSFSSFITKFVVFDLLNPLAYWKLLVLLNCTTFFTNLPFVPHKQETLSINLDACSSHWSAFIVWCAADFNRSLSSTFAFVVNSSSTFIVASYIHIWVTWSMNCELHKDGICFLLIDKLNMKPEARLAGSWQTHKVVSVVRAYIPMLVIGI